VQCAVANSIFYLIVFIFSTNSTQVIHIAELTFKNKMKKASKYALYRLAIAVFAHFANVTNGNRTDVIAIAKTNKRGRVHQLLQCPRRGLDLYSAYMRNNPCQRYITLAHRYQPFRRVNCVCRRGALKSQ